MSGATLASERRSTFSTPPVMLHRLYPTVTLRPDSPIVVAFDQDIDPAAIAKFLRVEDDKKRKLPFKTISLAAAQRAVGEESVGRSHDRASSRSTTSIIAAAERRGLPGSTGRVVLAKRSAVEGGPARRDRGDRGELLDRGAVRHAWHVVRRRGGSRRRRDVLGVGLPQVAFSNPIDAATYHAKCPDRRRAGRGPHAERRVRRARRRRARSARRYAIAIAGGITDVYGQPLVGASRLSFSTTRAALRPATCSAPTGMFVLDPRFEIPQWVIHAQAIASVHVAAVSGRSRPTTSRSTRSRRASARRLPASASRPDHAVGARYGATARVDLRPALAASGTGPRDRARHRDAGTARSSTSRRASRGSRSRRLGVTARIDGERMNAWAQDITPAQLPEADRRRHDVAARRGPHRCARAVEDRRRRSRRVRPVADADQGDDDPWIPDALLVAQRGDDAMFTAIGGATSKAQRAAHARWYVTDDRFTYKPGETGLREGLGALDAQRRQSRSRVAGRGDTITYSLMTRAATSSRAARRRSPPRAASIVEVALPANVEPRHRDVLVRDQGDGASVTRSRSRSSARPPTR